MRNAVVLRPRSSASTGIAAPSFVLFAVPEKHACIVIAMKELPVFDHTI